MRWLKSLFASTRATHCPTTSDTTATDAFTEYRSSYTLAGTEYMANGPLRGARTSGRGTILGTMGQAHIAAEAVLFLHVLWCVWVLLGWTVTRGRRVLRMLHIASLAYAIVIELVPWPPCPLTVAETQLEARAGIEPAHGPFLVHVLDAIVYPDLPEWLVVGVAVVVCVAILGVYLMRYLRRRVDGTW